MEKKTKQLYTPEGYQALVDELKYLKNEKREEVKNDIAVARSFGDLSENAEYDEARNEQAKVEARILELEDMIENAEVIDESAIDLNAVHLGSLVKVRDTVKNTEREYAIVGSNEVNPLDGKISDQSPIGKALLSMKTGDIVTVEVPSGELKLEILSVTRPKAK